jgi:hypothetical protein
MKTMPTISDTGYTPTGRGSGRTLITTYRDHKVRVTVHCDPYPRQAFTRAETWTPTGWTTVVEWDGVQRTLPRPSRKGQEGLGDAPLVQSRIDEALDVVRQVLA